jgi:hypothetical protein
MNRHTLLKGPMAPHPRYVAAIFYHPALTEWLKGGYPVYNPRTARSSFDTSRLKSTRTSCSVACCGRYIGIHRITSLSYSLDRYRRGARAFYQHAAFQRPQHGIAKPYSVIKYRRSRNGKSNGPSTTIEL